MLSMKRLVLVLAIVSIIGLPGGALAQTTPTTRTDTLDGIEISPGIVDSDQNIRFGAAFVGQAAGDLPGYFAAAVNFTPPDTGPGVTNVIIGGNWALTVIRNGRLRGTLFGRITGGTAVWDDAGKMAAVSLTLSIAGGTKTFSGATGNGTFEGVLDHTPLERRRPPTIRGTLSLTF
jgi:hypothetical protein